MLFKAGWAITKNTFKDFGAARVPKLAAALAYYTVFSLPGLLIIVIWITDIFYGRQAIEGSIYGQIAEFVGRDAAVQIQETIRKSTISSGNSWAAAVGIATLVIGATGVFSEIQDSINQVWHLKAKPRKGKGWIRLLVNRLLSFSMIVTLGFLLLVSLTVNGIMDMILTHLSKNFPNLQVFIVYAFNFLFTFLVTSFLFGIIFKVLPDARIKWKDVRAGSITTALLFMAGKFIISFYLGQNNKLATAYGAAGSIIVVLLWVYYSAIILYLGAVFTRAYAINRGCQIYPNDYAVWVEQTEVESHSSLKTQAKKEELHKAEKK